MQRIEVRDGGKDPKDGTPFSYYVTSDKKYFQLMAFQEEDPQTAFFVPSAYARDYSSNAYPVVK